jgi:hypothetical protein
MFFGVRQASPALSSPVKPHPLSDHLLARSITVVLLFHQF